MSSEMKSSTDQVIKAFLLPGAPEDAAKLIRPARPTRDWMDRTPEKYVYRCTPLSAANTMGWEILNPVNCEFRWTGLTPQQQIFVYRDRELRFGPKSHFGSGIVTWELPFLFKTPPDYGMVVTGPANHDRDHIVPLDGFIRSDWLPFPFTMNWRITTPDLTIRFEEGEPIARIFPFPLALLDETRMELHDLSEDPEFERQFLDWGKKRQQNYQQRGQAAATTPPGENPNLNTLWNRQYAKGKGADQAAMDHQTVFRCQPVEDKRNSKD
jgi:hypothetical protein